MTIAGDNMDPAIAAGIRERLDALDDLWRRYEAAGRRPIDVATLAGVDNALPHARFVSIHAAQALASALDHLTAWRLLIDAGHVPIQAHMTLMRGALEGSVRCRWLVDATVDSMTRVGRGYAAKREDFRQLGLFESSREGLEEGEERPPRVRGKSAADRIVELEAWRSAAEIPTVGFNDTTSLMITYGNERWFRIASAAAHGKEWALLASKLEAATDVETSPGVSQGMVSASDDVVLGLTIATLVAVARAVVDFEAYKSAPAPVPILEAAPTSDGPSSRPIGPRSTAR